MKSTNITIILTLILRCYSRDKVKGLLGWIRIRVAFRGSELYKFLLGVWPEALFRRVATLPLSDFVPLNYETIIDQRCHCQVVYIYSKASIPFSLYRCPVL